MSIYNVPGDWEEIRSGPTVKPGDFEGDGFVRHTGILIGWRTPDGFVSPDKLPPEYKAIPELRDADGCGHYIPVSNEKRNIYLEGAIEAEEFYKPKIEALQRELDLYRNHTICKYCGSEEAQEVHDCGGCVPLQQQLTEAQNQIEQLKSLKKQVDDALELSVAQKFNADLQIVALREAVKPFQIYFEKLHEYDWPARNYPDSIILHFDDVSVTRKQAESLLKTLTSTKEAGERIRREWREAFENQLLQEVGNWSFQDSWGVEAIYVSTLKEKALQTLKDGES